MKHRFTTWLIAALLMVAANFGAPAVRVAMPGAAYGIVWVDQSRAAEREAADISEPAVAPAATPAPIVAQDTRLGPVAILDESLFQRPPPVRA